MAAAKRAGASSSSGSGTEAGAVSRTDSWSLVGWRSIVSGGSYGNSNCTAEPQCPHFHRCTLMARP